MPPPPLIILDWQDIVASETSPDLLEKLDQAIGSDGAMGLVALRNVPGFVAAKQSCLPMAHALQNLPPAYLEQHLTHAPSLFNTGWSHGKEQLKDDAPDLAKASFYYNPLTDEPGTADDREKYPLSYPPNVFPNEQDEECQALQGFEQNAKALGVILKRACAELAKHIDALALQKLGADHYQPSFLYNAMKETEKAKARLLYYYPLETVQTNDAAAEAQETKTEPAEDSWIGWHNDSGFLTALSGDMYVNHATGEVLSQPPDPAAGLYIVDRNDQRQHVLLPPDCLAVQIGECTSIVTGGAVRATPHCVRGATAPGVARISLPCFVDTPPAFGLQSPPGSSRDAVLAAGCQSRRVPPLEQRWTEEGMTFGDFLSKTFALYYNWSSSSSSDEDSGEAKE